MIHHFGQRTFKSQPKPPKNLLLEEMQQHATQRLSDETNEQHDQHLEEVCYLVTGWHKHWNRINS